MDGAIITLLGVLITGQFGLLTAMLIGRRNHKRSNPNGPILSQLLNMDTKMVKMGDEIGKWSTEQAATQQAVKDLSARADRQDERFERIEKRIFDGWGA